MMNPHRTMPEPCHECARREAEEAAKKRQQEAYVAMQPRKKFDWGLFALIGLLVFIVGSFVFAYFNVTPSSTPLTCYRVEDSNESGVQLQRARYHRWTAPGFVNVQAFVSRAEAEAFVVAKKVTMCR